MRPLKIGINKHKQPIFLTDDDLLTHVHGVGGPRQGKSKLIEQIARQLILDGQPFCLVDPHGSAYRPLVQWLAYVQPRR